MNFYQSKIAPIKESIDQKRIQNTLQGDAHKSFLYRGLSNAEYKFAPSIKRKEYENALRDKDLFKIEEELISIAKSKIEQNDLAKHFNSLNKQRSSEQEQFWGLYFELRHLGLPLSVQEWTTSIDVALFFATQNTNDGVDAKIGIFESSYPNSDSIGFYSKKRADVNTNLYVNHSGFAHSNTENYSNENGLWNMYLQGGKFIFQEKSKLLLPFEDSNDICTIVIPATEKASVYECACKNMTYQFDKIEQKIEGVTEIIEETVNEVLINK